MFFFRCTSKPKKYTCCSAVLFCILQLYCNAECTPPSFHIMTSLQPVYSIALNLVKNTSITIDYVEAEDCTMSEQSSYFKAVYRTDAFKHTALMTDAVFTLKSLWKDDSLYTYTALHNIFAIPLDIVHPLNPAIAGVSLLRIPAARPGFENPYLPAIAGEPSLYVWLNLLNGAAIAECIADGLIRMSPNEDSIIRENLNRYTDRILDLKNEYEEKMLATDAVSTALLSPDCLYLANSMSLYISDYLFKDSYDYTGIHFDTVKDIIRSGTKLFIAPYRDERLAAYIIESGGTYIEVQTFDSAVFNKDEPTDIYLSVMRNNLETVYRAVKSIR